MQNYSEERSQVRIGDDVGSVKRRWVRLVGHFKGELASDRRECGGCVY